MNVKQKLTVLGVLGGLLYLTTLVLWIVQPSGDAATITTGYTFSSGETNITHTKLNNAINNATISGITSSDIQDGAVTSAKLAAGAVSGITLGTNVVTGGVSGNIALNTITTTNMANGTLIGVEVSTAFDFRANSVVGFTNSGTTVRLLNGAINSAAVLATNAGGASATNFIPRLNSAGVLDPSLFYASSNKQALASGDNNVTTGWLSLASITTVATNGNLTILGQAVFDRNGGGNGAPLGIRLIGPTTNVLGATAMDEGTGGGNFNTGTLTCQATDVLAGVTRTYTLQGIGKTAAGTWILNGSANGDADVTIANGCNIIVIEHPRR